MEGFEAGKGYHMEASKNQALRALMEAEKNTRFWGAEYVGHDVLSFNIHGDGKQLLCITMINSRPWSYFIFIDSSFDTQNADSKQLEEILCLLEDEYCDYESMCESLKNEGFDPHGEDCHHKDLCFPVVDTSCGYSWNLTKGLK